MGIVTDSDHLNYRYLLDYLFHIEFTWSVKGDENRASDGLHLRSIFEDESGMSLKIFEDDPCNVLEMLVALSVRGSENILWDGENNWTPFIFWTMIDNLGLKDCMDGAFNEDYVEHQLLIFLERKYDENGRGGLFLPCPIFVPNPKNFQKLEIWYQMQYWISANFV
ncbi:MAG: hypothetical protein J6Y02_16295 [Pseudobutyrivibrio sp.]|nr:hypothetical protein [Pseudobutyrivibrio sp.]